MHTLAWRGQKGALSYRVNLKLVGKTKDRVVIISNISQNHDFYRCSYITVTITKKKRKELKFNKPNKNDIYER